jgi:hypothetical protein
VAGEPVVGEAGEFDFFAATQMPNYFAIAVRFRFASMR